jgi:cold shock protein
VSIPRPQDQILYCERCAISFLWSVEEQKEGQKEVRAQGQANTPLPSHCPACRILLPAGGRERGLVKWYNHRKRYGFLVRKDQPEIFAHGSDIQGVHSLRPGDLVEFTIEIGERGPAATQITILDHTEAPILD